PNIIFHHPNLHQVIQALQLPILFNQPQLSTPPSTVLLQSAIYRQFFPKFKQPFQNIKLPHPFHQHTKMTPRTGPQQ
ncbi:aldehyde dehydrogenase family protein, partial [Staphylococcus epidermidis]|uniref:aldehyde dehydrogenase family protein n=1 Tax=Staphylococcus epidermidis TaxID=1282 RepID=UPI0011AA33FE